MTELLYILLLLTNLGMLGFLTMICIKALSLLGEMAVLIKSESLPEVQQYNLAPKTHAEATAAISRLQRAEEEMASVASQGNGTSSGEPSIVRDMAGNEYDLRDIIKLS